MLLHGELLYLCFVVNIRWAADNMTLRCYTAALLFVNTKECAYMIRILRKRGPVDLHVCVCV